MKSIAVILLLIYEFVFFIAVKKLDKPYEKELRNNISLIVYLIPIAMCIILAI